MQILTQTRILYLRAFIWSSNSSFQIFIGNYHFNIIDQGGAMVAIPYGTPSTQYLKYV